MTGNKFNVYVFVNVYAFQKEMLNTLLSFYNYRFNYILYAILMYFI